MADDSIPAWMKNGCPATYLPLIRKLSTGVIAKEMYDYFEQKKLLPEEQKLCSRGSYRTKDQLLIDKTVFKDCKKRHTNLSIAWIDYKKAYGFVSHSWINEFMELFGITYNVRNFLEKRMELSLTSKGEDLEEVNLKRRIFQGDILSPLFALSMVPLSLIFRKANASYDWGKRI